MTGIVPVVITNHSARVSGGDVQKVVAALRQQVMAGGAFEKAWGVAATLEIAAAPKVGEAQILVLDNSDQAGALGYHELTVNGDPLGKIFVESDMEYGCAWSVTLSHELMEQLVDPYCCYAAQGGDGVMRALEVADAVEDDSLGYQIDGVLVSDFVCPRWFTGVENGMLDYAGHLHTPGELGTGGYISVLGNNGSWTQVEHQDQQGRGHRMLVGSRRWLRSTASVPRQRARSLR